MRRFFIAITISLFFISSVSSQENHLVDPDSLYNGTITYMLNDSTPKEIRLLKGNIVIELLSKSEFEKQALAGMKAPIDDFSFQDSVPSYRSLEISCDRGQTIQFVNNFGENDDWDKNYYVEAGPINLTNKRLLYQSYYEGGDYLLVDTKLCKAVNVFHGWPVINQDQSWLATLSSTSTYEEGKGYLSSIGFYKIGETGIVLQWLIEFDYLIDFDESQTFFDEAGFLYFKSSNHWNPGDGQGTQHYEQYFKLNVLML